MSVNSVLTGLPPSYGPLAANNSQTAKSGALAKELPGRPFNKTDLPQVTGAEAQIAGQDSPTTGGDPTHVGPLQSVLERALREGGAAAGRSASGSSGSPGGGSSAGIALYQRISQYGNSESSMSALLKSWNEIVQGGQIADSAVATFAKTLSQNETLGLQSSVLDLTA
jgi:hypothetical protein